MRQHLLFFLKWTLADIKTAYLQSGRWRWKGPSVFGDHLAKRMRVLPRAIYPNSESVFHLKDTLVGPKWS